MFWKKGEKNFNTRKNAIIIGSAGSGKCHHPWDDLKPCPCGCEERPLLMYEKDKLYCGGSTENVFAICSICGRHTEKSDMVTTINNWNNDKTKKDAKRDVFVVKYKERSTGRVFEINPKINNSFYDRFFRNAFQTGEYILISGELPEKWK